MHSSNVVAAWTLAVQDRLTDGMRQVGLDSRELASLTLVAEHDGCSTDWLRRRVGLTQSGTVRLLDRLTQRGLLRRQTVAGREVPLHVTPAGRRALKRWAAVRDSVVAELLAGVSQADRDRLVRVLASGLQATHRQRLHADMTCRACSWPACGVDCPVDRGVRAAEQ